MSGLELIVANKNYSSWSLRPWLALKHAGLAFDEVVVPLKRPDTRERLLSYTGAAKVPVLRHGDLTIWDSLAILEYVAELAPDAGLWPADPAARAVARAAAAEMHSSFTALRSNMPMNMRASLPGHGRGPGVAEDVARITALWADLRGRFGAGGPFLFGAFGNVDAMYAPVVSRFLTYGVELDGVAADYVRAVRDMAIFREWEAAGAAETWTLDYPVLPPA